jgi:hypothetical protein
MTRKKEEIVQEMTSALEAFEGLVLDYLEDLEAELAAEKAGDNYPPLMKGLERQIAMVKAMHIFIDEDLWEQLLLVANMSQSLSHRRTRRFF